MFPEKYQNALFLADWSEGRILAVQLKPNGASYTANTEVFLQGQPLNVTDLDVGPDGWLYFVTGGRGTGGGVYRVTYNGNVPESAPQSRLRHCSGDPAAAVAECLEPAGDGPRAAATGRRLGAHAAGRGAQHGQSDALPHPRPRPDAALRPQSRRGLLLELSNDKNEIIRAKAAELMGIYGGDETHERLVDLLEDSDRNVRRKAMEALARAEQTAPPDIVIPMLASDDRFEAWAARRLLELSPPDQWRAKILSAESHRIFIQGALALLIAEPSEENALAVIERASELMTGFVSDRDFIDMLRVMQVAMLQGETGTRPAHHAARSTGRGVSGRRSRHEP